MMSNYRLHISINSPTILKTSQSTLFDYNAIPQPPLIDIAYHLDDLNKRKTDGYYGTGIFNKVKEANALELFGKEFLSYVYGSAV